MKDTPDTTSELREAVARIIGTAILKNDKNYTNDMMELIQSHTNKARIDELKSLDFTTREKTCMSCLATYIVGLRIAQLKSNKENDKLDANDHENNKSRIQADQKYPEA